MTFALDHEEKVRKAIPRLARKQAEKAMAALRGEARPRDRVHEARTAVKKLRALLRLVQPALGARHERENARLRKLGHALSELRDAEVLVATFDGLFDHFEEQLGPPLRRVRTRLTTRLRGVEERLDLPARLRDAERAFDKTRKRARRWRPRRGGWEALAGGLQQTYRWGRQALGAAYHDSDDAAFHGWRKAVKYHGHHVTLLAAMWPDELEGRRQALGRLGDLLGEDHDLAVFAETLRSERRCFDNDRDQQVLLGLIRERQGALRAMARPLGRRLFAEPPAAFTRRLSRIWHLWRSERAGALAAAPEQPARAAS
jgi:CHAD domain-containing protein